MVEGSAGGKEGGRGSCEAGGGSGVCEGPIQGGVERVK